MPIKAVIFDLDDTLFDSTGQLMQAARRRASEAIAAEASDLRADAVCSLQVELSEEHGSAGAIREICKRHRLPGQVAVRALEAYNSAEVEAICPFPGVKQTLDALRGRGYRIALVTSGRPARQREKVRRLGLDRYFEERRGTLTLHDDSEDSAKDGALQQSATHLGLPPNQILSVGDKLDAEIAASNRLGMSTARLRHGRQGSRRPETPEQRADYQIDQIPDLLRILP
jgi:FMN phosphatase YigB (HAD superfamily)